MTNLASTSRSARKQRESFEQFDLSLRVVGREVQAVADQTKRVLMAELWSSIIQATPVDTGRTRNNWMITLDQPNLEFDMDKTGGDTNFQLMDGKNWINRNVRANGRRIHITNNVHYAYGLETGTHWYGFSRKAPAGMVRVSLLGGVVRTDRLINGIIRRWNRRTVGGILR